MISKKMHIVLKEIPHSPQSITFKDLSDKELLDVNLLKVLLKDADTNNYISFNTHNPYNDILRSKFALTEDGQVAIEEYEGTKYNTKLSTWAIVLSGLSLIVAIVAIVVSCFV